MLRFAFDSGSSLRNRNRQASGKIGRRDEVTAIRGHTADRYELAGLARERFGDYADPSISRDHDVEFAPCNRGVQGLAKMRVRMNVLDLGADLRNFVCSTMKDRDPVPTLAQAVREKRSTGPRAADNQSALHGLLILAYLRLPLVAGRQYTCAW